MPGGGGEGMDMYTGTDPTWGEGSDWLFRWLGMSPNPARQASTALDDYVTPAAPFSMPDVPGHGLGVAPAAPAAMFSFDDTFSGALGEGEHFGLGSEGYGGGFGAPGGSGAGGYEV